MSKYCPEFEPSFSDSLSNSRPRNDHYSTNGWLKHCLDIVFFRPLEIVSAPINCDYSLIQKCMYKISSS